MATVFLEGCNFSLGVLTPALEEQKDFMCFTSCTYLQTLQNSTTFAALYLQVWTEIIRSYFYNVQAATTANRHNTFRGHL